MIFTHDFKPVNFAEGDQKSLEMATAAFELSFCLQHGQLEHLVEAQAELCCCVCVCACKCACMSVRALARASAWTHSRYASQTV